MDTDRLSEQLQGLLAYARAEGLEGIPAKRDAYLALGSRLRTILIEHGIVLETPAEQGLSVEHLLAEAELSPGPETPATRALIAVLRRLLDGSSPGGWTPSQRPLAERAVALFDVPVDKPVTEAEAIAESQERAAALAGSQPRDGPTGGSRAI